MKKVNILGYDEGNGVYKLTDYRGHGQGSDDPKDYQEKFELGDGLENVLRFSLISRHLRWLQGEILTILDAGIDDDRKLKAIKDLVRGKISAKISWLYEMCGKPENEVVELDDLTVDEAE